MHIDLKAYIRLKLKFVADLVGFLVEFLIARPALSVAIWRGAVLTGNRRQNGKLRTLWGVTPIVTLPLKAQSDIALGFISESLVLTNYHISNEFTWNLKWTRFLVPGSKLQAAVLKLVLAGILLRYDIIHYFADRGVLPPQDGRFGIHLDELRVLERAGKSVYVFAYGADVRTRRKTLSLGKWNFCRDCDEPGRYCICDDDHEQDLALRTSQQINRFVAMGDMLEYLPDPAHLSYWPIDTEKTRIYQKSEIGRPMKIFHAPNHTHFKGTIYLDRAVDELTRQGEAINLLKISGVPNQVVMQNIIEADLVVDQLIGGAYGYTALEAMARGKPVITYVRDSRLIVGADDCPLINATPDNIKDVLTWCLNNRVHLVRIGRQGHAYVERYHCVSAVAARFAKLYCETMSLPPMVVDRLSRFQYQEDERAKLIPSVEGWQHQWRVPSTV